MTGREADRMKNEKKETIGVIGLGLIGASLCKALKAEGHRILGMDADGKTQQYALLAGMIDGELLTSNVGECSFLFLATYPGGAVESLRRWAPYIRRETIAADLCGVKRMVCRECFRLAEEYGFTFIGGHPMAGRQFSGIKYATPTLYRDASMILVPKEGEDLFSISRLSGLMRAIGFKTVTVTTAEEHDMMIAYTSQLAHVVSNAYIKSPTARRLKVFSGGSFRDLTRVAGLNETMWTELFLENADHLERELGLIITELQGYLDALKARNAEELCELLKEGRERKEELDREWNG